MRTGGFSRKFHQSELRAINPLRVNEMLNRI
jgi:hypothetical protein